MKTIVDVFTSLSGFADRLGNCAIVGVIAGALAGVLLAVLDLMHGVLVLSNQEVVHLSLLLTAFTWACLLFLLTALVRLTFQSVALPALLNCLLTCLLLVLVCNWLGAFAFAWILGMLIGAGIGRLLCFLNAIFRKREDQQP